MANVVLPKVRIFIPCLGVDLEPGLPCTIHNPLHTIRLPPGAGTDYVLDEMWFYVVLTDGVGTFRLSVELYGGEGIIAQKSAPHGHTFKGGTQLNAVEMRIQMRRLPFARPGLHELRFVANHAHLEEGGTAFLRVLPE